MTLKFALSFYSTITTKPLLTYLNENGSPLAFSKALVFINKVVSHDFRTILSLYKFLELIVSSFISGWTFLNTFYNFPYISLILTNWFDNPFQLK